MFKITSSTTSLNRVYGYFDKDSFEFIKEIKNRLIAEKYSKISLSKIILLAVIELKENNSYTDIKQKMIQREMI